MDFGCIFALSMGTQARLWSIWSMFLFMFLATFLPLPWRGRPLFPGAKTSMRSKWLVEMVWQIRNWPGTANVTSEFLICFLTFKLSSELRVLIYLFCWARKIPKITVVLQVSIQLVFLYSNFLYPKGEQQPLKYKAQFFKKKSVMFLQCNSKTSLLQMFREWR